MAAALGFGRCRHCKDVCSLVCRTTELDYLRCCRFLRSESKLLRLDAHNECYAVIDNLKNITRLVVEKEGARITFITESATAPRLMPLGFIVLSPCSRHRFARRQHEVTQTVTAHAVNSAGYQSIVMLWRWVIRVLSGRRGGGVVVVRGLRPNGLTHG